MHPQVLVAKTLIINNIIKLASQILHGERDVRVFFSPEGDGSICVHRERIGEYHAVGVETILGKAFTIRYEDEPCKEPLENLTVNELSQIWEKLHEIAQGEELPEINPKDAITATILASFPSAHHAEIKWIVDLPETCNVDKLNDALLNLEGVDEINGGNPACGPQMLFSIPPEKATPERLAALAEEIQAILGK